MHQINAALMSFIASSGCHSNNCTQIVMVLLDTYLLNTILSYFGYDSYYPALGYHQQTKSCFILTNIRTNQQLTDENYVIQKATLARTT